jgi:hypothetical protein
VRDEGRGNDNRQQKKDRNGIWKNGGKVIEIRKG